MNLSSQTEQQSYASNNKYKTNYSQAIVEDENALMLQFVNEKDLLFMQKPKVNTINTTTQDKLKIEKEKRKGSQCHTFNKQYKSK